MKKRGAYYNEIDKFAAQWIRNLIDAGLIAPGDVDERSIVDVKPDDLVGYAQCHFFAGIAVWSFALRNAGWPDDREVWTGSCPCQPFSIAGSGKAFEDERHLWPEFYRLIGERRPSAILGEQVTSPAGRAWLAVVRTDLENAGYAVGAADLCAAGVGAPHKRQRIYWMGYTDSERLDGQPVLLRQEQGKTFEVAGRSEVGGLGDSALSGLSVTGAENIQRARRGGGEGGGLERSSSASAAFWSDCDWLFCRDGYWRPAQAGSFPLAPRSACHVGKLRAAGNAIVPQVAEVFVRALLEYTTQQQGD